MRPWLIILSLSLAGCAHQAGRDIVRAQAPGVASGAGATLTGPANSAAASAQQAERITVYQPAAPSLLPPVAQQPAAPAQPEAPPPPVEVAPTLAAPTAPAAAPAVAWTYERTATTLGQHQDAAGIVKVAVEASKWGMVRWAGVLCILVCLGGLLWSHGNPDGYPLVFWKVGGVGVLLLLVGDHPAWLLLLILPLGFYAAQRLNLLRLP